MEITVRETYNRIYNLIRNQLNFIGPLHGGTELCGDLGMDSLDIETLLTSIEDEFDIEILPISMDTFETINHLANFTFNRLNNKKLDNSQKRGYCCDVCGDGTRRIKSLPIYVNGSEGVSICFSCELDLANYIRSLQSVSHRTKKSVYKRRK